MIVNRVCVPASRVGLPDLDQCVRNGPAVGVEDTAGHDDPLAERLGRVPRGQIAVRGGDPLRA